MSNESPARVLYDASGNPVGLELDGSIYRLQTDAKIAKNSSGLVHLETIDVDSGIGRLKTSLYTVDGDPISFSGVPSNPVAIANDYVYNGSNHSLLVDGSVTPVEFTYPAHATKDASLQEIFFILASNSITFGVNNFGAIAGPLPNGVLVEVTSNGNAGEVDNLFQNECFVAFASPGGFQWIVSSKDMMYSQFVIGGSLKLKAGTSDCVKITVRDDLTSAGALFCCRVKANLLE